MIELFIVYCHPSIAANYKQHALASMALSCQSMARLVSAALQEGK